MHPRYVGLGSPHLPAQDWYYYFVFLARPPPSSFLNVMQAARRCCVPDTPHRPVPLDQPAPPTSVSVDGSKAKKRIMWRDEDAPISLHDTTRAQCPRSPRVLFTSVREARGGGLRQESTRPRVVTCCCQLANGVSLSPDRFLCHPPQP